MMEWHQLVLKAFSYIEMLIVLMIISIIIVIVPKNSFEIEEIKHEEINDEIISLLNYYQTKAIVSKAIIYVSFPPGSDTIYIKSATIGINASYRIDDGYIDRHNSSYNIQYYFDGRGINKGGSVIYYIGNKKYRLIFQIHWGRMRIEAL